VFIAALALLAVTTFLPTGLSSLNQTPTPSATQPIGVRIENALRDLQKSVEETKQDVQAHRRESKKAAQDLQRRLDANEQRQKDREARRRRSQQPPPVPKDDAERRIPITSITMTEEVSRRPLLKPHLIPDSGKSKQDIIAERDMLAEKVRRQNRTNLCRFLGFGCIKLPK